MEQRADLDLAFLETADSDEGVFLCELLIVLSDRLNGLLEWEASNYHYLVPMSAWKKLFF